MRFVFLCFLVVVVGWFCGFVRLVFYCGFGLFLGLFFLAWWCCSVFVFGCSVGLVIVFIFCFIF
jgi:hypothetical protein